MPEKYIERASEIMTILENDPSISWDSNGQITKDNQIIKGSNLSKIIPYFFKPEGFSEIENIVKNHENK